MDGEDDYWFLSLDVLCALLEDKEPQALAKAKIAGRRKGFERFLSHEQDPPMFLKGNVPMDLDQPADGDSEGVLKGLGTSPGSVTARARMIATQKDISLLEKGDILVCHGTDPGWTSAFSIVSGVVAQTGGGDRTLLVSVAGVWPTGGFTSWRHEAHRRRIHDYGERQHRRGPVGVRIANGVAPAGLYRCFTLSFRDIEEMLVVRGMQTS